MKKLLSSITLFMALLISMVGVTSAAATITVDEDNANWGFLVETGAGTGEFVNGPGTPPLGNGSAQLTLDTTSSGVAIGTQQFTGTRLDVLTALGYSTYNSVGNNTVAPALQINIDYDLTDSTTSWQGRLVFEPYYDNTIVDGTWQTWDALAGHWWSSGNPVVGDASTTRHCPISSPCDLTTLLGHYPDAGVQTGSLSGVLFKAGSGWLAGYTGSVDDFTIGINGTDTTYNFEPIPPCTTTCYVNASTGNDSNSGESDAPFATIQKGVDTVAVGGTVEVAAGTYAENVTINKELTLNGDGTGSTILEMSKVILSITASNVTVSNVTVRNGTQGARLTGTLANISFDSMVFEDQTSRGIEIAGATVTNLSVTNSTIATANAPGIRMSSTSQVDGFTVTGSTFDGNNLGIYQANDDNTSTFTNITVTGNSFSNHSLYGFYVEEISNALVQDNTFTNDLIGFYIFKSHTASGQALENVTVQGNTFTNNPGMAIRLLIQQNGIGANVQIINNTINQDASTYLYWYGLIDVNVISNFTNQPMLISNNAINVTDNFAADQTIAGVRLLGNVDGMQIVDNTMNGNGIVTTGTPQFGTPATAGVSFITNSAELDSYPIPATSTVTITGNTITGFQEGVSFYDDASDTYGNLSAGADVNINRNALAGINNSGTSQTVDGTCNWWGDASGPGGEGPGTGDSVSTGVTFLPWLQSNDLVNDPCEGGVPDVLVTAPAELTTSETGTAISFSVVLNTQPTDDVSITFNGVDATEGTANTVIFTSVNWNTPQNLTITGLDDFVDDGDIIYGVTLAATSTDMDYAGTYDSYSITNTDDDTAGLTVTADTTTLTEASSNATVSVVLDSQPTAEVTINITSADTSEGTVSTDTMTFTIAGWNTPQNVTVTGVDDPLNDGDQTFNVTFDAVSADALYEPLNEVLAFTTQDDEVPPVAVADSYNAAVGQTLTVDAPGVLANDTDANIPTNPGETLSAVLKSDVSQGTLTLNADGSFTYTSLFTAAGTDSFTYAASDGQAESNIVTVTITLDAPDGQPPRLYPFNGEVVTYAPDWPRFTFQHIPGIEWYGVWIGDKATSKQSLYAWYPATDASTGATTGQGICDVITNVCTLPVDVWLPNSTYSWWMTYWGPTATDNGSYWNETTFTVEFPAPSPTINRTGPTGSPASGITWERDPNVLWYNVYLNLGDPQNRLVTNQWYDATEICDETTCTLTFTGGLPSGNYDWWMQAWGPGGFVSWTVNNGFTFTIP